MANIKSAQKRIRKTARQQERNRRLSSRLRTAVKTLRQTIAAGDAEAARKLLPETTGLIDSTAGKRIIHRNAAARTKSRLTQAVASMEA